MMFLGRVLKKCPSSGKSGGMAHVSQIELCCRQLTGECSWRLWQSAEEGVTAMKSKLIAALPTAVISSGLFVGRTTMVGAAVILPLFGFSHAVADTFTISDDVTLTDLVQTGRLTRNGVASVAGTLKPF